MNALVLENLAGLPTQMKSLRAFLGKVGRTIDDLVTARALREVPEWRAREMESEIDRYRAKCVGSLRK